jgi:flavin reductase (DIM6/NTAB) family NADH-FMN oxidoreductase RutF
MNEPGSAKVDPATFRKVMGLYPTGVTVITSAKDGVNLGLAVGSFTSISLDPPLVGFFPAKGSSSWPKIQDTGRFCVNVLGAHQIDLSRHFASKHPDKFADISHSVSPSGLPLIDHSVAWIDCRIHSVQEIGDHYLVVGAVEGMGALEGQNPLIFLGSGYHGCIAIPAS